VFSIESVSEPFKSEYTGYYGLGPVENFEITAHDKWSIAYEMKKRGEISNLVTALYSCKELV
jgi:hypothetical protein